MDKKQRLVLTLCEHKQAVSAKALAEELNVSDRMIRKYVKAINDNHTYITSSKEGYRLVEYPLSLFESHDDHQVARLIYLLTAITEEQSNVDVQSLAEELEVSLSTIEQDLKQIKKMIEPTTLQLVKTQETLRLLGKEEEKRKLMKQILFQEGNGNTFDPSYYRTFFSLTDLGEIKRILLENIEYYHVRMTEFSLLNLAIHIGISIERISMNNCIEEQDMNQANASGDPMSHFADAIIAAIKQRYKIDINEDEYAELQFAILSRVIPDAFFEGTSLSVEQYVSKESIAFVSDLVHEIKRLYHIDFHSDGFIAQFALHIEKLMIRLQSNTYQDNPLYQTIKDEYPILFDIAVYIANELQQRYHMELDRNELAFLVLHLGNAMSEEQEHASMLTYEVALLYPMYYDAERKLCQYLTRHCKEHLHITCFHHIEEITMQAFDFLLSVFPGTFDGAIPILQIHPLPSAQDIDKIDHLCASLNDQKAYAKLREVMSQFEHCIVLENLYCENEAMYIQSICQPLCKQGIISEQFIQEVLKREKMSSTYIRSGLAIPHSSGIRSSMNFIIMIKNQKSVQWGKDKVSYIVLFGMTNKSNFLSTFQILIQYQKQLIQYIEQAPVSKECSA